VADLGGDSATAWVLQQFGDARLITFDRDTSSREPTVEVSHEALLREWPRLVGWLTEDADVLRSTDAIALAATNWDSSGRPETDLYRGVRLDTARGLQATTPDRLRAVDIDFIDASREFADHEHHAEVRRIRNLRRMVVGIGVALVLALVAGGIAFSQQRRASDQAELAEARAEEAELATLISNSAAQASDNPDLALLLALEANRRSPGTTTERAVLNAVGSSSIPNRISSAPLLFQEGEECGIVQAASGGLVLTGFFDGLLATRDNLTLEITIHGEPPAPCVFWDLDPVTGYRWATAPDSRTLWTSPPGGEWTEIEIEGPRFRGSGFSPSQHVLFGTLIDGRDAGIFVDIVTGENVGEPFIPEGSSAGLQLSPDGTLVAFSSFNPNEDTGGLIQIVDTETAVEVTQIRTDGVATSFAFDAATSELIAGFDNTITTFDLTSGDIVSTVNTRATARVLDMDVRPDGLLLVASFGQVEIIDRRSGPVGDPIELRNVTQSFINPNGQITTLTADNRLDTFDLAGSALIAESYEVDELAVTSFTPGRVGAVQIPNDPIVIDLATGERTSGPLIDPELGRIAPLAVYPDDTGLWMIGFGSQVTRWEDDKVTATIDLDGDQTAGAINTLVGDRLGLISAESGRANVAYLIDLASGAPQVLFEVADAAVRAAHPSPGGGLFVLDDDGLLRTIDAEGNEESSFETGIVFAQAITQDETTGRLAVGSEAGAFIIDLATEETRGFALSGDVANVAFARGGEVLVTTAFDGAVRIWDVDGDSPPAFVWDGSGAVGGSSPSWYDEATDSIWVGSSGRVLQIPLDPQEWIARACEVVSRDLTQEEWERFVPGDEPLQPACG